MKHIGKKIKAKLRANKIKIKTLLPLLGIKERQLSNCMNNHAEFKLRDIVIIAGLLNCTVDELINEMEG